MKILLGYGYKSGTTAYYYERAFKENYHCTTCGPGDQQGNQQEISCQTNSPVNPIIHRTKPDCFMLFPEGNYFFPIDIISVKIPKILILSDLFINWHWQRYYARLFDMVFIMQKDHMDMMEKQEIHNLYWLPNACDPAIHRDMQLPRKYDLGFVGTISSSHNPKRSYYLKRLTQKFNTKLSDQAWLKEMSLIYNQCKIIFNISGASDLNMRAFEAMGCGGMLLTDYLPTGLLDLFCDKKHLVIYRNLAEALSLTDYYLKHPIEREDIAKEGMREVHKRHTYSLRAKTIIQKIMQTKSVPRSNSIKPLNLLTKSYLFVNHPAVETSLHNTLKKYNNHYSPSSIRGTLGKIVISGIAKTSYKKRKNAIRIIKKLTFNRLSILSKWLYYKTLLAFTK